MSDNEYEDMDTEMLMALSEEVHAKIYKALQDIPDFCEDDLNQLTEMERELARRKL